MQDFSRTKEGKRGPRARPGPARAKPPPLRNLGVTLARLAACAAVLCGTWPGAAWATNRTWTGSGGSGFAISSNWSPSGPPGTGDTVFFATGSANCTIATGTTIGGIVVQPGYTGVITLNGDLTVTGFDADLRGNFAGPGAVALSGAASATVFLPANAGLACLRASPSSGTVILGGTGGKADSIVQLSGTLDLGNATNLDVIDFRCAAGTLDFHAALLRVTGNLDVSGAASLAASGAAIGFDGNAVTQLLAPSPGQYLPPILHTGTGTLRLQSYDLLAGAFSQFDGTLDLNGRNITVSGDFVVDDGVAASVAGLGGRTLTVGGDAGFYGRSPSSLSLDPGTAWTLAVAGTLYADQASIANSAATAAAGKATRATDGGGNSGWSFPNGYFWNRNPALAGSNDANKAYHWSGLPDGLGFRPPSGGDDDFLSGSLNGAWSFLDQDNNGGTGSHTEDAVRGRILLTGSGADISGSLNEFVAVSRATSAADGLREFSVKMIASGGKAGLFTANAAADLSAGGYCAVYLDGNLPAFACDVNGAAGQLETSYAAGSAAPLPVWLRLMKNGSAYTGWYRANPGKPWVQIGTAMTPQGYNAAPEVALFHCAKGAPGPTTSVFDEFRAGGDLASLETLSFNGSGPDADADAAMSGTLQAKTVDFTGYAGTFSMGNHILEIRGGNLVFTAGMGLSAASGQVSFYQSGNLVSTLYPKSGSSIGKVFSYAGPAATVVVSGPLTAGLVSVEGGTWDWGGTAYTHVLDSLHTAGGAYMNLGYGAVQIAAGGCDLTGLASLAVGNGSLAFTGTGSTQWFRPGSVAGLPPIAQAGSAGTTVLGNGVNAPSLNISAGTFNLGSGLTHQIGNLSITGGGLAFGSSLLRTGGDVNLASLATLAAGTGTLEFTSPSAPQTLTPKASAAHPVLKLSGGATITVAGNDLLAAGLRADAGVFDNAANAKAATFTGDVIINGGRLKSDTAPLAVGGDLTLSSGTLDCPVSGNAFSVAGSFIQSAGTTLNTSSTTLTLNGTASGKALDLYSGFDNLVVNGSGGTWIVTGHDLSLAGGLTLTAGTLDLSANARNASVGTLTVNGGTLIAAHSNLDAHGDFALTAGTVSAPDGGKLFSAYAGFTATGGTFTHNSGTVKLVGVSPNQVLDAGLALYKLSISASGAAGWNAANHGFTAAVLELASGSLSLGTGLSHTVTDSLILGGASLSFGSSTLRTGAPMADFTALSALNAGSGTLEFIGTAPQTYKPMTGASPGLKQNGTGGTAIANNGISVGSIAIGAGTLALGPGLAHSAANLAVTGGGLDFGSSTLSVSGATVDLSALATLVPGTGRLKFTGASAQTFTPKAAATHPLIDQYGAGGTTISGNGLLTAGLTLFQGTFHLGAGLTHTAGFLSDGGGGPYGNLDFGSSTLQVTGNASLAMTPSLTAGTGTLAFTGASGTQVFSPKAGAAHPAIAHSGASILRLGGALSCQSFANSAGTLDLNGFDLATVSGGDFTISNGGTSTFAGLGGRILTVAGNATLSGQAASHLDLGPASAWTLAVTGLLTASNADLRNSNASVTAGVAYASADLSGNLRWTFLDTVPPAPVSAFQARRTAGHAVALSWTPSASPDADSVMVRYRADGAYPTGPADGALWRIVPKSDTLDTAAGLPDKAILAFAAFARDSAGNFAPAPAGARDTALMPDVTPPSGPKAFSAAAIGPASAALAWTRPDSADVDSIMIRYRTDGNYPANPADGALLRTVPVTRSADTAAGLAANVVHYFGLFARDSSGNWSAAAAAARDTSLYQAPVAGSIAIADNQGSTRDVDPALAFAYSGADSLRFSLLADTASAPWTGLRARDSAAIGAGADGARILAAQFKNAYGRLSPWYRDTTLLDRAPPAVFLTVLPAHSWRTWPDAVAGKALDATGGTDSVYVIRRRVADGAYYNGSGWTSVPDTARFRADSVFSAPMPNSALATGQYDFTAWAKDKAGNASAPVAARIDYTANRPPEVATAGPADTAYQNRPVAWTVAFGDRDAGDSLLTLTASAPAWLTITETTDTGQGGYAARRVYTLAGTPGQADVAPSATLFIQAQDLGGKTVSYAKTFPVIDVNDPPVFAPGQDSLQAKERGVTRFVPRYSDPDPGDKGTLALLAAPPWAALEDSALVLRPGSRDVGKAAVRLTVSDGKLLDTLDIAIDVPNLNDAPVAFPGDGWQAPAAWKEDVPDSFTVVVVDMDKNDAVGLQTVLPSFLTYRASLDSTGYNHFFRFFAAPAQKDTGAISLKLRFQDAAGAASELALKGKVASVNDTPTAVVADKRVSAGAARVALDVKDPDGSAAATRFHYRLVDAKGDTVRAGICAGTVLALHPLADGEYVLALAAEDEGGLRQAAYTTTPLSIAGATARVVDSARWDMIAYPGRALPASALGAGAAIATWDEASSDGSPGRYASGKAADTLARGKGYWVKVARRAALAAPPGELLDRPFSLKLARGRQGWNQIGNPYPYYVDLGATGLTFWEWDPAKRDLSDAKGILKPWGAYWVQVQKDTLITIPNTPWFAPAAGALARAAASPVPGPAATSAAGAGDWSLRLSLAAGPYRDEANFLGVRLASGTGGPNAPERLSPASARLAEAPKFGEYVALYFERPPGADPADGPGGFATDFRSALSDDEEWWDFGVENRGTGEARALLSLPGLESLASRGLYAFLVDRGEARAVAADAPIALSAGDSLTHYSLVVTPHPDFAARLKGGFTLSQNFPNPARDLTTFRFFLPQAWGADGRRLAKDYRLRLNLYDFRGRLAATVAEGTFGPGAHALAWKPAGRGGSALAPGAYVYRLEAPGFAKSLKLIVK